MIQKIITTVLISFVVPLCVYARTVEHVSVPTSTFTVLGAEGNASSVNRAHFSISSDGRYVAFESDATNLVAGDTNGATDVFVYDRMLNAIERVSVATDGTQGDDASDKPFISSDGRYVAFQSDATNLVAGDTNLVQDIFVYDRALDTIERVSIDALGNESDGSSRDASISDDGQYVAFNSGGANLVADDTNGVTDVFVYDRTLDTIERVSVDSEGVEGNFASNEPSISSDGRYVAFDSGATNLVGGDTGVADDIFVYDRTFDIIERVSVDSDGLESDGSSRDPAISGDGRYVAFDSEATNLVAGDTNGATDVFVYDRTLDTVERMSVDSESVEGDSHSSNASISDDGRYVVFDSEASNLVAGDTNAVADIFVHDQLSGVTERVSVSAASVEGTGASEYPTISDDGRYVAFNSSATNLVTGDTNGFADRFVYDRTLETIELISRASDTPSGSEGDARSIMSVVSSDGRYVAFESDATNLVADDTNGVTDVFVYDRTLDTIERVSVDDEGAEGNGASKNPSISSDGRYVAFYSGASNFVVGDTNSKDDMFVYDRNADVIERVSLSSEGAENSEHVVGGTISGNGQYVLFQTSGLLTAETTRGYNHVFLYDRDAETLELIDKTSGGVEGDSNAGASDISDDGRYVLFSSSATNLIEGDTNSSMDVFVYDRTLNTIERVSVDEAGLEADEDSYEGIISSTGRYAVFVSNATNLVAGDTNAQGDLFVYDRTLDTIERVSVSTAGEESLAQPCEEEVASCFSISTDGRYVVFDSRGVLTPDDTDSERTDVFLRDRTQNTTTLINVNDAGNEVSEYSANPFISDDGNVISFTSFATDLVAGDTNEVEDIFVVDITPNEVAVEEAITGGGASGRARIATNTNVFLIQLQTQLIELLKQLLAELMKGR
ncbi:PD40 domain-containing protein [Candidatus Campbellbacteria bacterium]|nr:MAG: PD40 domain-containing protein [Candidatus Campbellbacteria bacterium]